MSVRSRRAPGALAIAATVTACLAASAIPATSALADEPQKSRQVKKVHVTGQLTLTDESKGVYRATGDLDGTWTIPPPAPEDNYYNTATTIIQRGTESFSGCLVVKNACGSLNSEYISWTYQQPGGRLISGGCVHALTGGTRGFKGVRGLLNMTDTPVGDQVVTLYQGELFLDAVREGSKPVPQARLTTTTTAMALAAAGSC